jgi:hypothetical protein
VGLVPVAALEGLVIAIVWEINVGFFCKFLYGVQFQ